MNKFSKYFRENFLKICQKLFQNFQDEIFIVMRRELELSLCFVDRNYCTVSPQETSQSVRVNLFVTKSMKIWSFVQILSQKCWDQF